MKADLLRNFNSPVLTKFENKKKKLRTLSIIFLLIWSYGCTTYHSSGMKRNLGYKAHFEAWPGPEHCAFFFSSRNCKLKTFHQANKQNTSCTCKITKINFNSQILNTNQTSTSFSLSVHYSMNDHNDGTNDHDVRTNDRDDRTNDHDDRTNDHNDRTNDHDNRTNDHNDRTNDHDNRTNDHVDRINEHDDPPMITMTIPMIMMTVPMFIMTYQ